MSAQTMAHRLKAYSETAESHFSDARPLLDDGETIFSGAFATALEAVNSIGVEAARAINGAIDPLYGLTEACRQLLEIMPNTGMQISEIVKTLEDRSFDFGNYTKPVSAVHTIFTRFCKGEEAKIIGRTPAVCMRRTSVIKAEAERQFRNTFVGDPLPTLRKSREHPLLLRIGESELLRSRRDCLTKTKPGE
jgi:hypothetical protein